MSTTSELTTDKETGALNGALIPQLADAPISFSLPQPQKRAVNPVTTNSIVEGRRADPALRNFYPTTPTRPRDKVFIEEYENYFNAVESWKASLRKRYILFASTGFFVGVCASATALAFSLPTILNMVRLNG